jgi:hypothetical protein
VSAVSAPVEEAPRARASFRTLAIATTALTDFAHCPRRFELLHLVDLPEPRVAIVGGGTGDARAHGTLAHRVLERVAPSAFGAHDASGAIARVLDEDRVARENPARHIAAARAQHFLASAYATRIGAATIARERPFVLALEDGARTIAVRGAIDLLVEWPDRTVDVIDYKSARGPSPEPYALQLAIYTLAARAMLPNATTIRAAVVFLGGDDAEPRWLALDPPEALRAHALSLAVRIGSARDDGFPRVAVERCRELRCGYVGICHPSAPADT